MKKEIKVDGLENCVFFVDPDTDDTVVLWFAVDDGHCAADFDYSKTFKNAEKAIKFIESLPEELTWKEFEKMLKTGFEECCE